MQEEYSIEDVRSAVKKTYSLAARYDEKDPEEQTRLFVASCMREAGSRKIPIAVVENVSWERLESPYDEILRAELRCA